MLLLLAFMIIGTGGGMSICRIWPKYSLEKGVSFVGNNLNSVVGGTGGVILGTIVYLVILKIGNLNTTSQYISYVVSIPFSYFGGAIAVVFYILFKNGLNNQKKKRNKIK
jgi:uncharacterized protein YacL